MKKACGKTVVYRQLSEDVWCGFLPPLMRGHITDMLHCFEDYGYYGENTEGKVKWSAEQARGQLTILDGYLQTFPVTLQ